ncbi:MAG: M20/M25/M40 family metallo-hydrolase [Acidobacteriota bacterium]|nr:M20/M25/M40 family metallo-hydrolase [Acidobacteriota bacterium]
MRPLLTLALLAAASAVAAQAPAGITGRGFLDHVRLLSSDEMDGRGNGTEGLERAANYIAGQFRTAGLSPGGDEGSFDQVFESEVRVEPPATTTIGLRLPDGTLALKLGHDFYPLSMLDRAAGSLAADVREAPLVFAGYGISAPGLGYDDFAGINVVGAAVLVMTHEPQEHDGRSAFDGRNLTPGAALSAKATEARERGARLLLVVEDPSHAEDRAMRGAWWADPQTENMGIPVLRVSRDQIADALPDLDLEQVAGRIDRALTPASRGFPGVTVSYVERRAQFSARLRNVVGVLRGSNPERAGEAVVVGAHYDHVGRGGALSEAPEATGEIHNGADDNASGTAALIEMARAAARTPARFGRTIVFVAFAGEELGLRGSALYVERPAVPIEHTVAMINLDMVGRARGRLMIGVFDRRGALAPVIRQMRGWTRLSLRDFSKGGYAEDQSDVASFANSGVPAVAFFTGFHPDYHRPTDDWPLVDAEGGAEVARLALRLVSQLAQ